MTDTKQAGAEDVAWAESQIRKLQGLSAEASERAARAERLVAIVAEEVGIDLAELNRAKDNDLGADAVREIVRIALLARTKATVSS